MSGALHIAIVDDHPVFRQGLRMIVEALKLGTVQEFSDGQAFVDSGQQFDLALLDVCMPQMGGLDVLRTCPPAEFNYRPIILGTDPKPAEVLEAIELGVLGLLRKDAEMLEIIDAVEHVSRKQTYFPAYFTKMLVSAPSKSLTKREKDVLQLITLGALNKEIAEQLKISVHSVRDLTQRLYKKLGVQTRVEAVRAGVDQGIVHLHLV